MGWGAIAEVGHVGRNVELAKVMAERLGVVPIAPSRAFDAMEQALLAGHVEVAAAELSWTRLQALPALARAPKYAAMRDQATLSPGADGRADASALVEALAAQTPEAALATVTQLVVKQVAGVMRMSAAKLDVGRSLVDLGMDSLMVVELQLALEQQLGVSLPTLELMDMATVAKLARRVLDEIEKIAPRPGPGNAVDAAGAAANGAARANGAAAANGHGYGNGTGNVDDIDIDTLGDDALDEMLGTLLQDGFERGVATAKERLE